MKYDLHVHSDISDGKLNRSDITDLALIKGLEYICFTEHNNFENSLDLKKQLLGHIEIINGIEFDTLYEFSFHTLCYFDNYDNSIAKLIELYRQNTNDRIDLLLKKIFQIYKIKLSVEYLMGYFNKKYVTKREVIDWLILNGYAKNVSEAAGKFTSKTALSYVPKYSLDFEIVSNTINKSNGKVLLAHPTTIKLNNNDFEGKLIQLINKGLDGLEVVNSSKMKLDDTRFYYQLAKKYNLLTSGGSDFHDILKGDILGLEDENSKVLINSLKKTN